MPARFEALGVAAGLPREAVHSQLAAGIDVVVHVTRARDGRRSVEQIAVIERTDAGVVSCAPAVTFVAGRTVEGPGSEHLFAVLGVEVREPEVLG